MSVSAARYYFVIVNYQDVPIYEVDFSVTNRTEVQKDAHLQQFVAHAALDLIDEAMWFSNSTYHKNVDKFNTLSVSAFVTPSRMRFVLLHDAKNEEGIRNFFNEVFELFVKVSRNPFYEFGAPIKSTSFDKKVWLAANKNLF